MSTMPGPYSTIDTHAADEERALLEEAEMAAGRAGDGRDVPSRFRSVPDDASGVYDATGEPVDRKILLGERGCTLWLSTAIIGLHIGASRGCPITRLDGVSGGRDLRVTYEGRVYLVSVRDLEAHGRAELAKARGMAGADERHELDAVPDDLPF